MSDGMRPPMPQQRPEPGGVRSKMSMFNPTDMAAKAAMGDVRPDMTVGEFLQRNFGVSPNDPVQKLVEATREQMQNRTMAGKLGASPQQGNIPRPGAGAPTPQPAPRPQAAPQGRPSAGGLEGLIGRLS